MKLTGRGEFQIIEHLNLRSRPAPGLVRGIGDDCAVLAPSAGEELLVTADLLTEGVHFNRSWTDLFRLGRKSVSVNISDLAAMGARPRYLFLSLALPDDMGTDDIDRLLAGILEGCGAYGAALAGGDTCRSSSGLTLSVTALGSAPAAGWISRGGASVGDRIYVTGSVGDSALALKGLHEGWPVDDGLLERHHNPTARVAVGLALAEASLPTAMIDISDGLLGDLEHILEASGVGADLALGAIPLSAPFRAALAQDAALIDLALAGGEDYELLFTVPDGLEKDVLEVGALVGVPITCIGRIVAEGEGLQVTGPDGAIDLPADRGYKHFPVTT